MRWFRRASSAKGPEDRFANEVIALVRATLGLKAKRLDDFALRIELPDGGGPIVMNLHNIYAEARELSGAARAERLRKAVLAMVPQPRPANWADAAKRLLPAVRTSSWANAAVSTLHAGDTVQAGGAGNADAPAPFGKPLVPFVKVLCALDSEHSISFATLDDLSIWDVTDTEALRTATANLAEMPCEVHRNGAVAMILGPDGYASSWLAVPELLNRVAEDLGGTVVAVAPDRELLVLVDTDQHEAATGVLSSALERYESAPRQLSPVPYLVTEAGIEPWTPPPGHPAEAVVDKAVHVLATVEYAQQTTRLGEMLEKAGEDVHVAKHTLMKAPDGTFGSWAVWVKQVSNGLLPRVDTVMFGDNDDRDAMFAVQWDDVLRIAGDALHEEPAYDPPRWRYQGWPDPETLSALRTFAKQT